MNMFSSTQMLTNAMNNDNTGGGEVSSEVIPFVKDDNSAKHNEIYVYEGDKAEFTTVLEGVVDNGDGTCSLQKVEGTRKATYTVTKAGVLAVEILPSTKTGSYYFSTRIGGVGGNTSWINLVKKHVWVVNAGDTISIIFDAQADGYIFKTYGDTKTDLLWASGNGVINISQQATTQMFKMVLSGDMQGLAQELYPEDFE